MFFNSPTHLYPYLEGMLGFIKGDLHYENDIVRPTTTVESSKYSVKHKSGCDSPQYNSCNTSTTKVACLLGIPVTSVHFAVIEIEAMASWCLQLLPTTLKKEGHNLSKSHGRLVFVSNFE